MTNKRCKKTVIFLNIYFHHLKNENQNLKHNLKITIFFPKNKYKKIKFIFLYLFLLKSTFIIFALFFYFSKIISLSHLLFLICFA